MASPQLKNGYTKIANEIMDALINYRIPGEQMQCLLFVIRKTYGWNKKKDSISLSQFSETTGINKPCVCRALNKLINKNIIIKKDNTKIITYCLQENYKKWKVLSKKIIPIIKKDNPALSKKIHTKDTKTKDNTKDIKHIVEGIVGYLNLISHKNFRSDTKQTVLLITTLLKIYKKEDFKIVIDRKCKQWINDSKYNKYLRPKTLFGNNFESYLNETEIEVSKQGEWSDEKFKQEATDRYNRLKPRLDEIDRNRANR